MGIETTLFGGPPELGNLLKLANSQIGFMTIFAHPLFANVTDIIPAMGFAAAEILANQATWLAKAEQEKMREHLRHNHDRFDSGSVSPRSQSPVAQNRKRPQDHPHAGEKEATDYFPVSPLKNEVAERPGSREELRQVDGGPVPSPDANRATQSPHLSQGVNTVSSPPGPTPVTSTGNEPASRRSSGAFPGEGINLKKRVPPPKEEQSSNPLSNSQLQLDDVALLPENVDKGCSDANDVPGRQRDKPIIPSYDGANEIGKVGNFGSSAVDTNRSATNGQPRLVDTGSSNSPAASLTFGSSTPPEPRRTFIRFPCSQDGRGDRTPARSVPSATYDRTSTATSGGAASTTDVGTRTTVATVSPSTEATSFLSMESDDAEFPHQIYPEPGFDSDRHLTLPMSRHDFESKRTRAASAPTRSPVSIPSRVSTKNDVRTTVIGQGINGDVVRPPDVKADGPGTMRRRSRLRLAFWKKRVDGDEDQR